MGTICVEFYEFYLVSLKSIKLDWMLAVVTEL